MIAALGQAKRWGATVIIVAHQPRILNPVDKLLLLRDGRSEMFGPRDDVLAKLMPARIPAEAKPRIVKPASNTAADIR